MIRVKLPPFAALLLGLTILATVVAPLPAQAVRSSVSTPEGQRMLASYARAIEVMRRLPADDPHNWTFQANLHGFPADAANPSPLWGQCQHGNWWFLPWHRAYLHAFEKIVRVHSGDATFMLPYWNWSDPAARTLPAAFRNPASPLYEATRRAEVNSGADALDAAIVVGDATYALGRPAFFSTTVADAQGTFGGLRVPQPSHMGPGAGAIELSPHNYVHGWIGGNMSDPDRAARDPVFGLHHANIDRLWEVWLASGRQNPTDDATWANQTFTLYDENKRPFTIAVRDVLNTRALNYSYADGAIQAARALAKMNSGSKAQVRASQRYPIVLEPQKAWGELRGAPMQIALRLDAQQAAPLQWLARKNKVSKSDLLLVMEGISYETKVADSPLLVYLNVPKSANTAAAMRPYLADQAAFFGAVKHGTAHFRLGEAFERARTQEGFRPEALTITLRRDWYGQQAPANPRAVTFKKLTLLVEP